MTGIWLHLDTYKMPLKRTKVLCCFSFHKCIVSFCVYYYSNACCSHSKHILPHHVCMYTCHSDLPFLLWSGSRQRCLMLCIERTFGCHEWLWEMDAFTLECQLDIMYLRHVCKLVQAIRFQSIYRYTVMQMLKKDETTWCKLCNFNWKSLVSTGILLLGINGIKTALS